MIVHNLPLLLLTSPAVNNLTTRPKSLNGEANAFCFAQPTYPKEPLFPTSYPDCFEAIKLMTYGDKRDAPIYFSRDPSVGYSLPSTWSHGTCEVELDVDPPNEGDTAKMVDIGKVALTIAILCVAEPPRLGGRVRVGPKEVIVIFMYGREVPPKHSLPQIGQTINRGDQDPGRDILARLKGGQS